jgi:RNA polymerase sigma-70 factor (ECF subfamily)
LPNAPLHNAASTDADLLEALRTQQPTALADVYDRYSSVVYSVALRVLRDTAAAQDVMQEVFLQLWRRPDIYTPQRGSLPAWLAVVARNRSIDALRRKRPTDNVEDLQLSSNVDLGSEAERELMIEKVRSLLGSLPEEQRHALELAFFEGHTHTEIAEMTGNPLGTVKTRIRNALITIRKALQA